MLQLASRQRCDAVAARVAGVLQRCSTRRGNTAAACVAATLMQLAVLRQLASLRHCCSRRCFSSRRSNAAALL
ncbi:unnamed protein product [Sphagnum troendelagicum]|uniref:Uncharacterized protein n=1 Tax=Sphagnum troendelagicum TaxID=128251 RepID=A0ABP0UJY8_9BRYO